MSLEEHGAGTTESGNRHNVNYATDSSNGGVGNTANLFPVSGESIDGKATVGEPTEQILTQKKKAAKIHDFCFGIPFGGFILSGGILDFIFSRNPRSLATAVLFGGALLGLSTTSLKVWRQGRSSIPFILGQAVLAAALCWRNLEAYSLTSKVFPSGIYAAISAAMLCFYSYVVAAGGNPPPKKMMSTAN